MLSEWVDGEGLLETSREKIPWARGRERDLLRPNPAFISFAVARQLLCDPSLALGACHCISPHFGTQSCSQSTYVGTLVAGVEVSILKSSLIIVGWDKIISNWNSYSLSEKKPRPKRRETHFKAKRIFLTKVISSYHVLYVNMIEKKPERNSWISISRPRATPSGVDI